MNRSIERDWSQKYRPTSMEEMVLPDGIGDRLRKIAVAKGGISLLFYGKPGMGKTTIAKLINPENTLFLNCTLNNSVSMVKDLERTCSSIYLLHAALTISLRNCSCCSSSSSDKHCGYIKYLQYSGSFQYIKYFKWKQRYCSII